MPLQRCASAGAPDAPAYPIRRLLSALLYSAVPLLAAGAASAASEDKISTDRPDFPESSTVVGNGRLQVETSIAGERDHADGVRSRRYATPTLIRYGVGDTLELRLETDGRIVEHLHDDASGIGSTQRGFADTALGVKWHVLDPQGQQPSVAVLLHADLPSGSRAFRGDGVRPSLRVAAEWELPADLSLGVMPGISYEKDAAGRRYANGIFGIVLGKEWTQQVRSFVGLSAPQIAHARNGGSVTTVDIGAAYLLNRDMQIDTAIMHGLNRNAPDLGWTVGFSFRM